MQTPNWLSCIRSVAKYHTDAPLDAVYNPLRFKFSHRALQYTSTTIERILSEANPVAITGHLAVENPQ